MADDPGEPMQPPKACFFDVFGTLVDWRTSIAREAEAILRPLGHSLEWLAFADAWRAEYQPAMEEIRSGAGAIEEEMSDRSGFERQHFADGRSGAPQRLSLGCDPRLRDRRRFQA